MLVGCQTNHGDDRVNEAISVAECTRLLSDSTKASVLIALPDSSLKQTIVLVHADSLEIKPRTAEDIPKASFIALKAMYNDSEGTLNQINEFLRRL